MSNRPWHPRKKMTHLLPRLHAGFVFAIEAPSEARTTFCANLGGLTANIPAIPVIFQARSMYRRESCNGDTPRWQHWNMQWPAKTLDARRRGRADNAYPRCASELGMGGELAGPGWPPPTACGSCRDRGISIRRTAHCAGPCRSGQCAAGPGHGNGEPFQAAAFALGSDRLARSNPLGEVRPQEPGRSRLVAATLVPHCSQTVCPRIHLLCPLNWTVWLPTIEFGLTTRTAATLSAPP